MIPGRKDFGLSQLIALAALSRTNLGDMRTKIGRMFRAIERQHATGAYRGEDGPRAIARRQRQIARGLLSPLHRATYPHELCSMVPPTGPRPLSGVDAMAREQAYRRSR